VRPNSRTLGNRPADSFYKIQPFFIGITLVSGLLKRLGGYFSQHERKTR
jgi:hypothetical protein